MNQELNFNFFNILIIAASIQGILFGGVILLSKKYKSTPNFYLAQVVLYLSLSNLYFWFIDTNIFLQFSTYRYIYIPWSLLVLPLYYFFVKSYLKVSLTKKEVLYFLTPFCLNLIIRIILLVNRKHIDFDLMERKVYFFEESFSIVFTIFLIVKTFLLIKKNEIKNKEYVKSNISINTSWLKNLLYVGIVICIIWAFVLTYSPVSKINYHYSISKYILWLSISILIYWLGYLGVYHTGIFNQRQVIRENLILKNDNKPQKKLSKSKFEEIDLIIKNEKLYLNPQLSLELLAKKLNLSTGYLSKLFNEFTESNFSTYINKFRIQEAVKILKNEEYKNYTILAIALEVGFNSKSTFYNAFKKEMGCTPTQYLQKNVS